MPVLYGKVPLAYKELSASKVKLTQRTLDLNLRLRRGCQAVSYAHKLSAALKLKALYICSLIAVGIWSLGDSAKRGHQLPSSLNITK